MKHSQLPRRFRKHAELGDLICELQKILARLGIYGGDKIAYSCRVRAVRGGLFPFGILCLGVVGGFPRRVCWIRMRRCVVYTLKIES